MATPLDVLNEQLRRLTDTMQDEQRARIDAGLALSPGRALQYTTQGNLYQQQAQAQAAAARATAQTQYLSTPQGQAQYQATLRAQQQQRAAQDNLIRQQQVTQYGQLGAAVLQTRAAFASMNPYIAAASAAFGTMLGLVGKASPNSAATYSASVDIVQAKIGTLLIPAIEAASRALQKFSGYIPDRNSATGEAASGGLSFLARVWGRAAYGLFNPAAFVVAGGYTAGRAITGTEKDDNPLKRSMRGLPQPQIGGDLEDFQRGLQMAAFQTGAGTLEADLLKIQIQNMAEMNMLLQRIEVNTGNAGPAFR